MASSIGFPSAPASVSATPSPFISKAEPKLPGEGEIHGLPAGQVPISRPPSSLASSGVEEVSASAAEASKRSKDKDGKRGAEDVIEIVGDEEAERRSKKRKIDLKGFFQAADGK